MCVFFNDPKFQLYWQYPSIPRPKPFLAATRAALWMVHSVCLSVSLSITPFWLCSHHCITMKFSEVITNDWNDVHAKGQGHRSKVKVTEVITPLSRFRTVTPVWIHIWWWQDARSLMVLRRGALLFFKVNRQISRSHGTKKSQILTQIERFRTVTLKKTWSATESGRRLFILHGKNSKIFQIYHRYLERPSLYWDGAQSHWYQLHVWGTMNQTRRN